MQSASLSPVWFKYVSKIAALSRKILQLHFEVRKPQLANSLQWQILCARGVCN